MFHRTEGLRSLSNNVISDLMLLKLAACRTRPCAATRLTNGLRSAAPWRIKTSTGAGRRMARRPKTGTRLIIPYALFTHCLS